MSYASLSSCSHLMLAYLQAAANRCSRSSTERRSLSDYDVFVAAFACTFPRCSFYFTFVLCRLCCLLFASSLLRFIHFALAQLSLALNNYYFLFAFICAFLSRLRSRLAYTFN